MSDPARAALRAGAAYAALFSGLFLALGAQMAFLPLWYEDQGLSPEQIGGLTAFAIAVRILAGLGLPALADRLGAQRQTMAALGALGAGATALHLGVDSLWGLYALAAGLAAALSGLIPLTDASAFAAAERRGFAYAKARSAGSFAFLAATFLVGGLADRWGSDAIIWWMTLSFAAAALVAATMAEDRAPDADRKPEDAAAAPRPARASLTAVLRTLLTSRRFLLFLAAVSAVNASHAVYYVYGSLHWRGLGYSETLIGGLWAWGVLIEIGVFFFGRALLDRLGPVRVLSLAALAGVLRWSAMAADPGLLALIALQALHGLTFGATHLAAIAFIARAAPPGAAATAQGLMSASAGGLAMLAATGCAAWAYAAAAGLAYLVSALFAVTGLGFALALGRWSSPAAPSPAAPSPARPGGAPIDVAASPGYSAGGPSPRTDHSP